MRTKMTRNEARAGGTRAIKLYVAKNAELACVARVSVLVTALAPGVTLAGEKVAVHLLGSPEQLKDTEELKDPPSGLTVIV